MAKKKSTRGATKGAKKKSTGRGLRKGSTAKTTGAKAAQGFDVSLGAVKKALDNLRKEMERNRTNAQDEDGFNEVMDAIDAADVALSCQGSSMTRTF